MTNSRYLAVAMLLLFFALLISCSGKKPTPPDLDSPETPALLGPTNNGTEVRLDEALVWRCADPNGDSLLYALYFGETNPPPLLIDKLTDTSYVVKDIAPGKTYYWKVVATDPDGNSSGSRTMTFATTRSFEYPLTVGNRWGYDWTVTQDSVSGEVARGTRVDEATVGVVGDTTLFDSISVVSIQTVTGNERPIFTATLYSANTEDGMFTYAYTNGSLIAPGKLVSAGSFVVNGHRFGSLSEFSVSLPVFGQGAARAVGELAVEEPPVRVFDYPLSEGAHWTYRETGKPWQIDRRVVGWGPVETPAGKFSAFAIEALYDIDNDGVWDTNISFIDHVAPEGLISREITITDVEVYDENNAFLGVINFHETYVLRDYGSE